MSPYNWFDNRVVYLHRILQFFNIIRNAQFMTGVMSSCTRVSARMRYTFAHCESPLLRDRSINIGSGRSERELLRLVKGRWPLKQMLQLITTQLPHFPSHFRKHPSVT